MNFALAYSRSVASVTLTIALLSAPAIAVDGGAAPTQDELANASYRGVAEHGEITLSDGRWQGAPYVEGGASRPSVGLVEGFRLTADLNGDGSEEAVVMLWQSGGGSGVFSYLAVVGRAGSIGGVVRNLATAPIGDRVQLRSGRIDGGRIVLDVVQQGPKDAACCPSQLATRSWQLQGDSLSEGKANITGTLSLAVLDGSEWQLQQLDGEPVGDAGQAVTLAVAGERISGKSGCNRYSAGVTAAASPGEISVGPVMGTRMACPAAAMVLESRYLQALGKVTRFQFLTGKLLLAGQSGDGDSRLLFSLVMAK